MLQFAELLEDGATDRALALGKVDDSHRRPVVFAEFGGFSLLAVERELFEIVEALEMFTLAKAVFPMRFAMVIDSSYVHLTARGMCISSAQISGEPKSRSSRHDPRDQRSLSSVSWAFDFDSF